MPILQDRLVLVALSLFLVCIVLITSSHLLELREQAHAEVWQSNVTDAIGMTLAIQLDVIHAYETFQSNAPTAICAPVSMDPVSQTVDDECQRDEAVPSRGATAELRVDSARYTIDAFELFDSIVAPSARYKNVERIALFIIDEAYRVWASALHDQTQVESNRGCRPNICVRDVRGRTASEYPFRVLIERAAYKRSHGTVMLPHPQTREMVEAPVYVSKIVGYPLYLCSARFAELE